MSSGSLPQQIPSQPVPIGRVDQNGFVTIDINWYLFLYNLASQVFSNANGSIVASSFDIAQLSENAILPIDALQDKKNIGNVQLLQSYVPGITDSIQDKKSISNVVLLLEQLFNLPLPNPQAGNLSGIVTPAHGGTGLTSYTVGDLLYASGSTTLSKLSIGLSTYILTSSGSAPQWSLPSGITVGTATNAVNIGITANSTNATNYLTFVSATTGNLPQLVNSSISCNPSTGKITGGVAGGAF